MAQQWRHAEGVWIPKEENSSTIKQFRIISLLSVEGKIFFNIVAHCITEFLLGNTYIDTSVQKCGILKVPGCIEHIGVVTQLIREAREGNSELTVLWLNLANAYGSVPHKLVKTSLVQQYVPDQIRDLILEYYSCFSLSHLWNSNIYISSAGEGHNCWVYCLSDLVCLGQEHAR